VGCDLARAPLLQRLDVVKGKGLLLVGWAPTDDALNRPISQRGGNPTRIGELTLENDFLEGTLTKAGMLSANR
jgi:hypothetical protein